MIQSHVRKIRCPCRPCVNFPPYEVIQDTAQPAEWQRLFGDAREWHHRGVIKARAPMEDRGPRVVTYPDALAEFPHIGWHQCGKRRRACLAPSTRSDVVGRHLVRGHGGHVGQLPESLIEIANSVLDERSLE